MFCVSVNLGAEYATTCASEKLHSVTSHIYKPRIEVEEAETKLVEMQITVIDRETEFSKRRTQNKSDSVDQQTTNDEEMEILPTTGKATDEESDIKDIFDMSDDRES